MLTERQVLEQMLETFKDKNKWTQKTIARDKLGQPVTSYSYTAVCWCVEGLLDTLTVDKVIICIDDSDTINDAYKLKWSTFDKLCSTNTCCNSPHPKPHLINDIDGYEKTMQMISEAIELCPIV